ncbi:hypothetical protein BDV26DRAFT_114300 [Aspergillus bertholletiae]|uniref:Uncharacterized protein n=1 Tax=Aspergillus bertholletiae TaxID=1226010 RepID=A0A5N7APW5_9EURO|nr:hypothetical protein BDV26DRAFT_114300 [Aspergillus bertholletiae]
MVESGWKTTCSALKPSSSSGLLSSLYSFIFFWVQNLETFPHAILDCTQRGAMLIMTIVQIYPSQGLQHKDID